MFSAVAGCSGSDSALRDRIARSIAPVQESVDFDVIIPSYLPEGTQKGPALPWLAGYENDEVILTFYPNDPDNEANVLKAKRPSRIEIREDKAEGPSQTPDPETEDVISRVMGWRLEWMRIKGIDTQVRRAEDPGSARMGLGGRVGEVDIGLDVDWSGDWSGEGIPPVVELTPDMEREVFRIFESMIE
jgi:hypothetical protein